MFFFASMCNEKGLPRLEMELMPFLFAFEAISDCHGFGGDIRDKEHILAIDNPMGVHNGFSVFGYLQWTDNRGPIP